MLRFMALCLVAGLILPFNESSVTPTPPEFSNVFTVKIEYSDFTVGIRMPVEIWFDKPGGKALRTLSGGTTKLLVVNPDTNMTSASVFPVTTEDVLNRPICINFDCNPEQANRFFNAVGFPDLKNGFKYIGKSVVNGEVANGWSKWEKPRNATMWVSQEELGGSRQVKPLRLEVRDISLFDGSLQGYYTLDYYHYNSSAFDPEVFNITKDMKCFSDSSVNMNQILLSQMDMSIGHNHEFARFPAAHGKQYAGQEEQDRRREIFNRNLKYVEAHNSPGHGFKLGVNHFANGTDEELAAMRGRMPSSTPSEALPFPYSDAEIAALSKELPEEFDWRPLGAVTPVRGSIEGAFTWIMKHGLPAQGAYGDYLLQNGLCHIGDVNIVTTISGYVAVKPKDENALKVAIYNHGPVAVKVDSSRFPLYHNGVFRSSYCKDEDLNHAALVVGWGVLNGEKYWLIKNSWSTHWGIAGYLMIAMDDNMCGVMTAPYYVTI